MPHWQLGGAGKGLRLATPFREWNSGGFFGFVHSLGSFLQLLLCGELLLDLRGYGIGRRDMMFVVFASPRSLFFKRIGWPGQSHRPHSSNAV